MTYRQQLNTFMTTPILSTARTLLTGSSMMFRKQLLYWAVDNADLGIFKEILIHPDLDVCTNVIHKAIDTQQFEMAKILMVKWKLDTRTLEEISIKIDRYVKTTSDIMFLDVWNIQCICNMIVERINGIKTFKSIYIMSRLYRYRIKRAKSCLYYSSINVIYNPRHPVGKICVQKEIDNIMNMYENRLNF